MDGTSFSTTVEGKQRSSGLYLADQPIVRDIVEGSAAIPSVRAWAEQWFLTITKVTRLAHSRPKLPVALFDKEMKRYMWENRVEEEYGALSGTAGHVELMLRFAESIGSTRLDMAKVRPLPETTRLLDFVEKACREEEVVKSQIMLGFVEAMMPEACRLLVKGLRTNYGMAKAEIAFFSVHIVADEEHGEVARRLVELVPVDELDALAEMVLRYSKLFIDMWTGGFSSPTAGSSDQNHSKLASSGAN